MNHYSVKKIAVLLIALALSTIACGVSIGGEQILPTSRPTLQVISPSTTTNKPIQPAVLELQQPTKAANPLITTNEEQLLVDLYKHVNPSVVTILTLVKQGEFIIPAGQGSGFLYDSSGNIVTNSHVIHGVDRIEVTFSDGFSVAAAVVGDDPHSDLAVIHVEKTPDGLTPVPLGNMDEVAVGQTVVALGNPFGFGGTLTRGIVSALGRSIPALTPFSIPQAIQTDAPINPGNSGGPLLNLVGQVIGVNAQIETSADSRSNSGVGFAIPVSIITRVIPSLIQKGEFQWSWLGVIGGNLNSIITADMGLPVDRGAYVSQVSPGGPAELAGLHGSTEEKVLNNRRIEVGGDLIVGINGTAVNSYEDILIYIALNTNPGDQVILTVIRDGGTKEIPLTLQARPNNTVEFSDN